MFDTSIEAVAKKTMRPNPQAIFGARPIALGDGVAKGFVEGTQLIGKGGKITLIIPSKLGWGAQGGGPIAPYAPTVFDIELKDIKKPVAGALVPPVPVAPTTAPTN